VGSFLDRAKGLLGRPVRPAAVVKPGVADTRKPATFHAVSVIPGPSCCAAAKAIEGRRFLSKDAPVLPLKGCDRSQCACHYQHHQDRRTGPRRAREMGVAIDGWAEEDRRAAKRGRRKTDGK